MNDFIPIPEDVQTEINGAMAEIFRPLVRFALLNGLKFQSLSDLLKAIYVEQARKLPDQENERVNVSQLSVATGLHRRDITRLLDEADDEVIPTEPPLEAEVFTRWITDPRFRDKQGQPLELLRVGRQMDEPSFDMLARTVTKDIHPRAVLDSMLRLNLVQENGTGLIALRAQAFVPQPERKKMLDFLAHNLRDHTAAATSNMNAQNNPFLEQSVYGQGLTPKTITLLQAKARDLWKEMFNEFVQTATQLEEQDHKVTNANERFRMGIYFYSESKLPKDAS
jgi:hypothetical protein